MYKSLVLALDSHVIRSCGVSRRQANNVSSVCSMFFVGRYYKTATRLALRETVSSVFPLPQMRVLGKKKLALNAYFC